MVRINCFVNASEALVHGRDAHGWKIVDVSVDDMTNEEREYVAKCWWDTAQNCFKLEVVVLDHTQEEVLKTIQKEIKKKNEVIEQQRLKEEEEIKKQTDKYNALEGSPMETVEGWPSKEVFSFLQTTTNVYKEGFNYKQWKVFQYNYDNLMNNPGVKPSVKAWLSRAMECIPVWNKLMDECCNAWVADKAAQQKRDEVRKENTYAFLGEWVEDNGSELVLKQKELGYEWIPLAFKEYEEEDEILMLNRLGYCIQKVEMDEKEWTCDTCYTRTTPSLKEMLTFEEIKKYVEAYNTYQQELIEDFDLLPGFGKKEASLNYVVYSKVCVDPFGSEEENKRKIKRAEIEITTRSYTGKDIEKWYQIM